MVEVPGNDRLTPKDFACSVGLNELPGSDSQNDESEFKNKIGGQPDFLQGEEYPSDEKWHLLFQFGLRFCSILNKFRRRRRWIWFH